MLIYIFVALGILIFLRQGTVMDIDDTNEPRTGRQIFNAGSEFSSAYLFQMYMKKYVDDINSQDCPYNIYFPASQDMQLIIIRSFDTTVMMKTVDYDISSYRGKTVCVQKGEIADIVEALGREEQEAQVRAPKYGFSQLLADLKNGKLSFPFGITVTHMLYSLEILSVVSILLCYLISFYPRPKEEDKQPKQVVFLFDEKQDGNVVREVVMV